LGFSFFNFGNQGTFDLGLKFQDKGTSSPSFFENCQNGLFLKKPQSTGNFQKMTSSFIEGYMTGSYFLRTAVIYQHRFSDFLKP
jgi:hypothetical protein